MIEVPRAIVLAVLAGSCLNKASAHKFTTNAYYTLILVEKPYMMVHSMLQHSHAHTRREFADEVEYKGRHI